MSMYAYALTDDEYHDAAVDDNIDESALHLELESQLANLHSLADSDLASQHNTGRNAIALSDDDDSENENAVLHLRRALSFSRSIATQRRRRASHSDSDSDDRYSEVSDNDTIDMSVFRSEAYESLQSLRRNTNTALLPIEGIVAHLKRASLDWSSLTASIEAEIDALRLITAEIDNEPKHKTEGETGMPQQNDRGLHSPLTQDDVQPQSDSKAVNESDDRAAKDEIANELLAAHERRQQLIAHYHDDRKAREEKRSKEREERRTVLQTRTAKLKTRARPMSKTVTVKASAVATLPAVIETRADDEPVKQTTTPAVAESEPILPAIPTSTDLHTTAVGQSIFTLTESHAQEPEHYADHRQQLEALNAEREQRRVEQLKLRRMLEERRLMAEAEQLRRDRIEREARQREEEKARMEENALKLKQEQERAKRQQLEREKQLLEEQARQERLKKELREREEQELREREAAERCADALRREREQLEQQRREAELLAKAEADRQHRQLVAQRRAEAEAKQKALEVELLARKQRAILHIQCWWRMMLAVKIKLKLIDLRNHRHHAATIIQSRWRGYRCRLQHSDEWHRARQQRYRAAVTVQRVYRGWRVRRRVAAALNVGDSDNDDEFDYEGVDPHYYTIDMIDELDDTEQRRIDAALKLIETQQQQPVKRSTNSSSNGRSRQTIESISNAPHGNGQRIEESKQQIVQGAAPDVAVACSRPKYSYPAHVIEQQQIIGKSQTQPAQQPQPSPPQQRAPSLPMPTSVKASPPPPPAQPSKHHHTEAKSLPVAAARNVAEAWGISDPRTVEAIMKKQRKMAKISAAKKRKEMSATERWQKATHQSHVEPKVRHTSSHGTSGSGSGNQFQYHPGDEHDMYESETIHGGRRPVSTESNVSSGSAGSSSRFPVLALTRPAPMVAMTGVSGQRATNANTEHQRNVRRARAIPPVWLKPQ